MGYKKVQYNKVHKQDEQAPKDSYAKPIMVHDMFSEERITFNREAMQNTELCGFIAQLGANTEEELIGVVASYLKCELNGAFTPDDMAKLYTQFTAALKQMRVQSAGEKLLVQKQEIDHGRN